MIRKILVYDNALADKHPALERAMELVRHNNAKLKIVDVVDGPTDNTFEQHRPLRNLVEQERKDRLDSICEPLRHRNIEFTTELIHGRPFVEIAREVVHEGFHLVIKAATGKQPADAVGMMGPVDMRLVRNCPCPVWLEAPGRDVRCERILVAVDPQAENDELNKTLLEMASSLAQASSGVLHVVSAWEVRDEDILAEKMQPEELSQYVNEILSGALQRLDALLVGASKPAGASNVHLGKGDPAKVILDCIESYQPDVMVVGTVGRTNVRGLLIGNTADTVLRQIDCAVLVVRPDSLFRA